MYYFLKNIFLFVFTERFATSRYQEPTVTNTRNVFMHLTNYAVNKHSRTYVVDDEAGSKRYMALGLVKDLSN
jgi:tubulin polyglutamylase TTLL6/13